MSVSPGSAPRSARPPEPGQGRAGRRVDLAVPKAVDELVQDGRDDETENSHPLGALGGARGSPGARGQVGTARVQRPGGGSGRRAGGPRPPGSRRRRRGRRPKGPRGWARAGRRPACGRPRSRARGPRRGGQRAEAAAHRAPPGADAPSRPEGGLAAARGEAHAELRPAAPGGRAAGRPARAPEPAGARRSPRPPPAAPGGRAAHGPVRPLVRADEPQQGAAAQRRGPAGRQECGAKSEAPAWFPAAGPTLGEARDRKAPRGARRG